jgi:hypothetical protein
VSKWLEKEEEEEEQVDDLTLKYGQTQPSFAMFCMLNLYWGMHTKCVNKFSTIWLVYSTHSSHSWSNDHMLPCTIVLDEK